VRESAGVHHAGPPPLPDEASHPPSIAPLAQHLTQTRAVDAVEVSTASCLHDPATPLRHAPLAERVPGLVRAAALSEAVRAGVTVLRVDRFQQHRYRSLDELVLERGLADGALAPIGLLEPDPLYGRCLLASTAETRVHVVQVRIEVVGRALRRDPLDPRSTGLTRVAVRFAQQVLIAQVGQGRQDPIGIAGGLRRTPLELWCDGW